MPQVGFEPAISTREKHQTHDLKRAATAVDNTNSSVGGFFELEIILRKRTCTYVGYNGMD